MKNAGPLKPEVWLRRMRWLEQQVDLGARLECLWDQFDPRASRLRAYGSAVALVALALLIRLIAAPVELGSPYLTLLPAVLLSCFLGGIGPAVLATALVATAIVIVFLPLLGAPGIQASELWVVLAFLAAAALGCAPIEIMRRAVRAHARTLFALRKSEARLEDSAARLRGVVDTAVDGIITIGDDGIVETANPAAERIFGYSASELVGRNVKLLMPEPYRSEHDVYLANYRRTGERKIIGIGREVEGQRKDGTVFPIDLAVSEVWLGERRIFTGIVRDISAQKRAEEQLRQSQKMEVLGQLTGGIAHDFNNLLTAIIGNLEMLESAIEQEEDKRVLVREALEAAELGGQLTHRLLAFGRRQPLQPKTVDLNELVAGMTSLLRRTLGEAIEISTVLASGLGPVRLDPGQAESAFLNLAINARDAMPDGGRLIVETERAVLEAEDAAAYGDLRPGRYAALSVTDTGVGMPSEVRDRAFEPFFTTKRLGMGTGLGLSMVYGFARQSGGHAQIYSEPGGGTTVRLYLPEIAEDQQNQMPARDAAALPHGKGEVILLVEDDPRVRRTSAMRLAALGYRVLEAGSGPEALAVLDGRADSVDLLFTDITMPGGMTGLELAHAARARCPDLQVLLTSGYAGDPATGRDFDITFGWLKKPHTRRDLATAIDTLLHS